MSLKMKTIALPAHAKYLSDGGHLPHIIFRTKLTQKQAVFIKCWSIHYRFHAVRS